VRILVTPDSDSDLPRDAAVTLIGTMAHPLNRAEFDERVGRVTRGYGIMQPSVSVSLASANGSRYAAIFAGHPRVDPYPTAVSDVYQDLFAEGTYTGKGLAALIREQFSLRFTALALGCVLLANTGLVVSEFAGIGAAFGLLGVSRYIIIPIAAVAIWALVLFGSYRYAERIFLVMSLAFLSYPIAAIVGVGPAR